MKKAITVLFAVALLSQSACISSLIKDSVKDTPLNNKIFLHTAPRVGDYATFQGANGTAQVRMKIIGRSRGLFIVRSKTGYVLPGVGFRNTVTIDIYADRRGNVRKGFLVEGDKKTPLKVATRGQNEFMTPIRLSAAQKRKFGLGNRVTVQAGTFRVSTYAYKSMKNEKETIVAYQINPRAKFRHVAGFTFIKNGSEYQKHPALELIEQGNRR